MPCKPFCGFTAGLFLSCLSPLYGTITNVQLTASPSSPQVLGTTITLTASATDSSPGPLTYKWELQQPGSTGFTVMRDFDVVTKFVWTPNYTEGTYQFRLTARDYLAGTSAQTTSSFQVNPLVIGGQAVVVATANPLVALLSAPTCATGSTMRVFFQQSGISNAPQSFTDWRACHSGSMNFYIAGMAPNQTYQLNYQVQTGGNILTSGALSFTTGSLPSSLKLPSLSVPVPIPSGNPHNADIQSRVLVMNYTQPGYVPMAMDLSNPPNILWYYDVSATQLTRPVAGGTWLAIANGFGTGTSFWYPITVTRQQILREIDLAGNVLRETNADRVAEQLADKGVTDVLGRFDNDAIRLSNGDTIVLGDVQRIFPAGTQGSSGPVDIIGAIVMVLNSNFQLVSYWNAFDHDCTTSNTCLSISRAAVLNETCTYNAQHKTPGGCPPELLATPALDWLHANNVQLLTSDGNLAVSMRNQDWVVKIDYQNGSSSATGNILWRLGNQGDFTLLSPPTNDPFPWFSGQFNPGFVGTSSASFTCFDNGNTRIATYPGNSRGQVYTIDQTNLTATINLNVDLGSFSPALGSAQALLNGDYAFVAGNPTVNSKVVSQNTEYTTSGDINYQLQANTVTYRGWRLTDFYNVPNNGSNGPAGVE